MGVDEGLKRRSVVKLDHVQTVEKRRLGRCVGSVPPGTMAEACRALAVAVGFDP